MGEKQYWSLCISNSTLSCFLFLLSKCTGSRFQRGPRRRKKPNGVQTGHPDQPGFTVSYYDCLFLSGHVNHAMMAWTVNTPTHTYTHTHTPQSSLNIILLHTVFSLQSSQFRRQILPSSVIKVSNMCKRNPLLHLNLLNCLSTPWKVKWVHDLSAVSLREQFKDIPNEALFLYMFVPLLLFHYCKMNPLIAQGLVS